MRTQLKALAGQRLFGTGAFYRVINSRLSTAYARALTILGDWDREGHPLLEAPAGNK